MPSPVTIRPASHDDDAALRALDTATWSRESSPAPPAAADAPFFAPHDDPADVLVAVVGDRTAGYVHLGPGLPLASNRHVMEVVGLAVDPAFRGRALGVALLEAVAQEAARRGATKLSLRVLAPNAAARAVYARAGFVQEGVLRGEFVVDGQAVDDVLMARRLTSSS